MTKLKKGDLIHFDFLSGLVGVVIKEEHSSHMVYWIKLRRITPIMDIDYSYVKKLNKEEDDV